MATAARQVMIDSSTIIASTNIRGGEFTSDLYSSWHTLQRTRRGRYFVRDEGGPGVTHDINWLADEAEAQQWLLDHADDPITGYGYSEEQVAMLLADEAPGPGCTDRNE